MKLTSLAYKHFGFSVIARSFCGMADLSGLPFAPADLSWDKLKDVMDHMNLPKAQAVTVLNLVLGAPSVSEFSKSKF